MKRYHISPTILVTFAELAWIIVFILVFTHIVKARDSEQQLIQVRKEIVGLKGPLKRVVMLFDISGSMSNQRSGQGRWELARNIVATWLDHLPFDEVALILFNDDIRIFPEDGTLINVRGTEGKAARMKILDRINRVEPSGDTDTFAALERAYRYPNVDTIIFFTDGKPYVKGFPDIKEKIYQLCRDHRHIPVNAVGLGNYFEGHIANFLLRVAHETGGTFLVR